MPKLINDMHALLFGLAEDLAGDLLKPLRSLCTDKGAVQQARDLRVVAEMPADVIFCDPDVELVSKLRTAKPDASIVVVSRFPEMSDWLDSIEAGATDYCAAPFERSQVQWILETSMHSVAA